jgi:uncharacterized protein (TIGR02058 family)
MCPVYAIGPDTTCLITEAVIETALDVADETLHFIYRGKKCRICAEGRDMVRTRLIVELGTGVDMHGGDYTKAARRAVENAIRHGSLLYFGDVMKEGIRPKMYVDVTIAAPKPDAIDGEAVLEALPFGEKTIKIVAGGMEVEGGATDSIIICNAAVLVTVES